MIDHLRVFSLILVGEVCCSLVYLELRGASMESVSHVDNVDTSHLVALKENHNSQARDLQLQNLQLVIWVEPRECTQWSLILLQGERVQWDPHSEFLLYFSCRLPGVSLSLGGVDVVSAPKLYFAFFAKLF